MSWSAAMASSVWSQISGGAGIGAALVLERL